MSLKAGKAAPGIGDHNDGGTEGARIQRREILAIFRTSGAIPHFCLRKKQAQDVDVERHVTEQSTRMSPNMATQKASEDRIGSVLGPRAESAEAAGALRRRVRDRENRAGECDTRSKVGAPAKGTVARIESAGRIGRRQGKVSELTSNRSTRARRSKAPARFPGSFCHGSIGNELVTWLAPSTTCASSLDNDTKLLFCTAYDGDWDAYIEDFATKIPDILDLSWRYEGWPGGSEPEGKRSHCEHQITADFWYVANPNLTRGGDQTTRRIGKHGRISRQDQLNNRRMPCHRSSARRRTTP